MTCIHRLHTLLLVSTALLLAASAEAARTKQTGRLVETARLDPLAPTQDTLHFQASFKLVAKGLKELEGWFYQPGLASAPWNRERGWWEDYGQPHVNYGEGEFPIGSAYDAFRYSAPPCQTVLEHTGGGRATPEYREYLIECQAARARAPRFTFERTEEWKFLERIDLHRQVSSGRFPANQFLTARLGNVEHQGGPIRAADWFFRLTPTGNNCMSGSIRIQLPSATVALDPGRFIFNWADHGWGVDFPGAFVHLTGLAAEPSFELCVGADLQPSATIGAIRLTLGNARYESAGTIHVDTPFDDIPIIGPTIMEGIVDAIANNQYEDATDSEHLNHAFERVRLKIEEQIRTALDAELQKLMATLPRAQTSLREGCAALESALNGGILNSVRRPETRELVRGLLTEQCAILTNDAASMLTRTPTLDPTRWGIENDCYATGVNVEGALTPGGESWSGYRAQDWYFFPERGEAPRTTPSSPWPRESGCRVDTVAALTMPDALWPVMKCVTADVNDWLNNTTLDPRVLAQDVKLDCWGPVLELVRKLEPGPDLNTQTAAR